MGLNPAAPVWGHAKATPLPDIALQNTISQAIGMPEVLQSALVARCQAKCRTFKLLPGQRVDMKTYYFTSCLSPFSVEL